MGNRVAKIICWIVGQEMSEICWEYGHETKQFLVFYAVNCKAHNKWDVYEEKRCARCNRLMSKSKVLKGVTKGRADWYIRTNAGVALP